MTVIRLKIKNICAFLLVLLFVYTTYIIGGGINYKSLIASLISNSPGSPCNRNLQWRQAVTVSPYSNRIKPQPLIGILGPPGSGTLWLRYLIEQMTGIYTGSVYYNHVSQFKGEGKITKILGVMAYDVDSLIDLHSAIVLYRGMSETVRTLFAEKHRISGFVEAPLHAYYGKEWPLFATRESKAWIRRYQQYLNSKHPTLILSYDELSDPDQVQRQLLRISNFLHMPVRQSIVECLAERANDVPLKPAPLRPGFEPFRLLPTRERLRLKQMEESIESAVRKAREEYRPKL